MVLILILRFCVRKFIWTSNTSSGAVLSNILSTDLTFNFDCLFGPGLLSYPPTVYIYLWPLRRLASWRFSLRFFPGPPEPQSSILLESRRRPWERRGVCQCPKPSFRHQPVKEKNISSNHSKFCLCMVRKKWIRCWEVIMRMGFMKMPKGVLCGLWTSQCLEDLPWFEPQVCTLSLGKGLDWLQRLPWPLQRTVVRY